MVRAGWSLPKFSASKFSQDDSTSGPSATSQPIATNTSAIRSAIWVIGCRAPRGSRSHGSVTSTASSTSTRCVALAPRAGAARVEGLLDLLARGVDPLAGLGPLRARAAPRARGGPAAAAPGRRGARAWPAASAARSVRGGERLLGRGRGVVSASGRQCRGVDAPASMSRVVLSGIGWTTFRRRGRAATPNACAAEHRHGGSADARRRAGRARWRRGRSPRRWPG